MCQVENNAGVREYCICAKDPKLNNRQTVAHIFYGFKNMNVEHLLPIIDNVIVEPVTESIQYSLLKIFPIETIKGIKLSVKRLSKHLESK